MNATRQTAAIEIRGATTGLLDDPLTSQARGAGDGQELLWRARFRDDDSRVWRASASSAEGLAGAWAPAKGTTGRIAALQSLRPLRIDVRAEAGDGRAAARALTRVLVGEGVRIRRWREGALVATLALPAGGDAPCATVVIDASAGPGPAAAAALAAPLLASRGVVVLAIAPPREGAPSAEQVPLAIERLAAVPGAAATSDIAVLPMLDPSALGGPTPEPAVVLPPGIATRDKNGSATAARATAWDALLAHLGARPRAVAQP